MPDTLFAKSNLKPGSELRSANGTFVLKFQMDGNLVLYVDSPSSWASGKTAVQTRINRAIWNTFTQGKGASHCALQADGNFVVYKAGGDTPQNALISTKTSGKGGNHLVVQDDGNVVLYTPAGVPVWQAGTSVGEAKKVNIKAPDAATKTASSDNLRRGAILNLGDELRSANLTFALKFQLDGNLVLFVDSTSKWAGFMNRAIWNTGTANKGATHCVLQADGNFVVYKAGGDNPQNALFSTARANADVLIVQDDGNVVSYNFDDPGRPNRQWETGTSAGETPSANTNAPLPAGFK